MGRCGRYTSLHLFSRRGALKKLESPTAIPPTSNGFARGETLDAPIPREEPRWRRGGFLAICAAVVAATISLRLIHIRTAYELFLDEGIYSRISNNLASHLDLSFSGGPFYLHPPLFFLFQAALLRLDPTGLTDPIALIDRARLLNVVFAVGNVTLLMIIVSRLAGRRYAIVAGLLYAIDPFIVRFDSRVLLEPSAVFWILLAIALLLTSPNGDQIGWLRLVAAGIACGLSLLTKETAAPLFLVLLAVAIVRGSPLSRRAALLVLGTAIATYAPYPLTAAAVGDGHAFVHQKFSGVLRMVGLQQQTGFNAPGAPSFFSRISVDAATFYPSYVLIAGGLCALPFLLRSTSVSARVVGYVTVGGFALLAYQITFGTLEEQMFYFLVVPSVLAVGSSSRALFERFPRNAHRVLGAAAAVVLVGAGFVWWHVHTVPDDGLRLSVIWVERSAAPTDVVAPLVDTSQLLVTGHRLVVNSDFRVLRAQHVRWVMTSSLQVRQGYGVARPRLIRQLRTSAVVAYRTRDRSSGTITVWRLPTRTP